MLIHRVSKEYVNLALNLAEGDQKVAMAHYMVGILYRSLGQMIEKGICDIIRGSI